MTSTLLTTAQVARLLGVSERTLRRWRDSGTGPPFIPLAGTTVRYREAALTTWLSRRETSLAKPRRSRASSLATVSAVADGG